MRIQNEDSKLVLYIGLGIGGAIATLVAIFGFLLMFGVGFEFIPTPSDDPGISMPINNTPEDPIVNTDNPTDKKECKELYDEIENELDEANYCEKTSDCDDIVLGGGYVEFGCYHYINKDVEKNLILNKMENYSKNGCIQMINKCAPVPEAQCYQKRCVPKGEVPTTSGKVTKVVGVTAFVGKNNGIGEEFSIESNFAPEEYVLKIKNFNYETGLLELEYDKRYLGSACSSENGTGELQLPYGKELCLISTTCDAGENVCFENEKVKDGIKIKHTVEEYDGERI